MRFNAKIYEKVYPPKVERPEIESSVDTFKPTEEKLKAMDHKPGETTEDPEPKTPEEDPGKAPEEPEKEIENE